MGKGFWDMDFSKGGFGGASAYDTSNKPMDTWYEWLMGPTGYDKRTGINYGMANPLMATAEGSADWGKTWSGGVTGARIGGNISPGWGHLIGGVIGAGAGGTFVGSEKENDGLAAAFRGNVDGSGMYGTDSNYLQMITTASDIYGANSGGGNRWNSLYDYAQPDTWDESYRAAPGERNESADYWNSMLGNAGSMYGGIKAGRAGNNQGYFGAAQSGGNILQQSQGYWGNRNQAYTPTSDTRSQDFWGRNDQPLFTSYAN